ncbi:MAG: PAS domain S-box protein, partial [Gemmatimonadetes bacterium]|nr:PAS domain S-box protein [Gemmatimonadota bacterium]
MNGHHEPLLVGLSVLTAIFASYAALNLVYSVSLASGKARVAWLAGGAVAMGSGIWSMHFIGMLAFRVPGTPVAYDPSLLVLSVVTAMLASGLALFVAARGRGGYRSLLAGASAMAAAIAGMHYIGMWSMRMGATIRWDRGLVAASLAIAFAASYAALWLAFRYSRDERYRVAWVQAAGSSVMGLAIAGMHYTAMAAAAFEPAAGRQIRDHHLLSTADLAAPVALSSLGILAAAILASLIDRRLRGRAAEILDSITDAFVAVDEAWRLTYVNRPALHLFGSEPEELLGRVLWEQFTEADRALLSEYLVRVNRERVTVTFEALMQQPAAWYEIRGYPTRGGLSITFRDITRQKESEQMLERSTATLQAVVDASPDVVELLDMDGCFRWVSPSLGEVLGYSGEDLNGTPMMELVHPDDRQAFAAALADVVAGRAEEIRLRYRARHRVGDWVMLEAHGRPVRHPREAGVVLIARDVTRDHILEERVRETQEVYRQLFDNNPFPMWTVDPESLAFLDVNRAATDRYGYSREAFLALTLRDIRPPEEVPLMLAAVSMPHEGDRFSAHIPHCHRTRDGTLLDVEVHSHSIVVQGQKIFVAVANDVTERRRAQAAVEESHQLVSSIVEGTPDTIYVKDLDGRYVPINSAGARAFGRPADQIIGQDDLALFPPELARTFVAGDAQVKSSGEMISYEERFSSPNGLQTFTTTKLPRHDPGGAIVGIIGISRNITKRKEAEEALRSAKEEAERANRAKSEFLSRMSHELRTPMNAILGFAQILEMDVQGDDDQESVAQILRAGRHLLSLIDEVLDLSKIEADRLELTLEPVSLAELSTRMLELVRSSAAQQEVAIEVAPSVQARAVRADPQRLGQVLLNLLSNGIKYNHAGGTVWIACTDGPEQRLRIEVTDSGRGIPPEKLERLFTPFDRLDMESVGIPGTGLGLSLSKRLVTAMGGEMGVYSVSGRGSTCWIELPRVDSSVMAAHADEGVRDLTMVASAERLVL